jgi:sugar phosphate isomerase/epimerase
MLRLAYDTAGCVHHGLDDALDLIAEAGYAGVVLTLSRHHFDPFADGYERAAERLGETLRRLDLALAVDTGAPYLMDARERAEPSLLHPDPEARRRRIDLVRRAIRIAELAGGETVSFAAGRPRRSVSEGNAGAFLLDGLRAIVDAAGAAGVTAALVPAPGEIVATVDDFMLVREAVRQTTEAPLRLGLDAGNSLATRDRDPPAAVKEFAPVLAQVSIADALRGSPHRVPFGEGDMNVPALLGALEEIGFEGLVTVALPREAHRATDSIARSIAWIQDHLPSD